MTNISNDIHDERNFEQSEKRNNALDLETSERYFTKILIGKMPSTNRKARCRRESLVMRVSRKKRNLDMDNLTTYIRLFESKHSQKTIKGS